ncbi:DUF1836 domain-containing protein [Ligilactobacillus faecis]|uniref:DUF1836 domain-containing protein n=1 Tax=Ligilactobacillus faecis TaxID=762833 RepID=A0ABV4DRH8_9LACO
MATEMQKRLQETIKDFSLPTFEEIPTVGLYLEQTSNFINSYLEELLGTKLTPSMISNYVKKNLIARPEKKLYSREQLAYLFFIALAKTVLPLDDLKLLVKVQQESYATEVAYRYFCEELKQTLTAVFEHKALELTTADQPEQKIMLSNIIITVAHKIYLEKYFAVLQAK